MLVLAVQIAAFAVPALAQGFEHSHKTWDALLKKHVVLISGAKSSQVDYAGMAKDRAALKAYLDSLSKVGAAEFNAWSKAQRMAFLR